MTELSTQSRRPLCLVQGTMATEREGRSGERIC